MSTEPTVHHSNEEAPKTASPTTKSSAKKSNKLPLIIAGVAVLLIAGLAAKSTFTKSANEKTAESIIEAVSGSKVDVNAKNGSYSVTDKETGESATVGANQKLPSDFPKNDIPYLNEKAITLVISTTKDGKKNWSVSTTVSQSPEEAMAYFEGKIKEPDYTNVASYGYNTSKTFNGENAKYEVVVTVAKSDTDKDTTVTYIVSEK